MRSLLRVFWQWLWRVGHAYWKLWGCLFVGGSAYAGWLLVYVSYPRVRAPVTKVSVSAAFAPLPSDYREPEPDANVPVQTVATKPLPRSLYDIPHRGWFNTRYIPFVVLPGIRPWSVVLRSNK